jgi:hypothetical protein
MDPGFASSGLFLFDHPRYARWVTLRAVPKSTQTRYPQRTLGSMASWFVSAQAMPRHFHTLALIANRVRQLKIAFSLTPASRPRADVIKAWSPLLPQCRVRKLKSMARHGLAAKRTLAVLCRPELPEERRIRRGGRDGHQGVRRSERRVTQREV